MKIQIRPAIYGENGLRYEAYEIVDKSTFWSNKREYNLLYFMRTESGKIIPIDQFTYKFAEKVDCFKSTGTIKEMARVIEKVYGSSAYITTWRP